MERRFLEWYAEEYPHEEKRTDWFWAIGIIALALAGVAILLKDFLFSIVILVGTFTLFIFAKRKPRSVRFTLTEKGVHVDHHFHPFVSFHSFWVDTQDETNPKILFKSQRVIIPFLVIPITNHDPEDIRDHLLDFLGEEEHKEPIFHKIMERFGF